jgi:hypothetical protein
MPLIPILLSLAMQFAPTLISALAGPAAGDIATKVASVAAAVTGISATDPSHPDSQAAAVAAMKNDPALLEKFQVEMAQIGLAQAQIEAASMAAQTGLNMKEAESSSMFIAGARPAFMWMAVACVGYVMAARGIVQAFVSHFWAGFVLPDIDASMLWPIVSGLFGLGTLRSFDKTQGVDTKAISLPSFTRGGAR